MKIPLWYIEIQVGHVWCSCDVPRFQKYEEREKERRLKLRGRILKGLRYKMLLVLSQSLRFHRGVFSYIAASTFLSRSLILFGWFGSPRAHALLERRLWLWLLAWALSRCNRFPEARPHYRPVGLAITCEASTLYPLASRERVCALAKASHSHDAPDAPAAAAVSSPAAKPSEMCIHPSTTLWSSKTLIPLEKLIHRETRPGPSFFIPLSVCDALRTPNFIYASITVRGSLSGNSSNALNDNKTWTNINNFQMVLMISRLTIYRYRIFL